MAPNVKIKPVKSGTKAAVKKRVNHAVPCTQVDNIEHLKGAQTEIKDDIKKIFHTIDGNSSGKGMKTDLALVKDHLEKVEPILEEIKNKLSSVSEINKEIEVQSRVAVEVRKAIDSVKADEIKKDEIKISKSSFSWQKFAVTVAALSFVVMAVFQILNYFKTDATKAEVVATKDKVDELGSPVVVNERTGDFVALPDGYSLKMWPKNFDEDVSDTILKDSVK